ncbi:YraN family protein [Nocardioides sp. zg-1228]|uniref:YraN family protein n=1 Tax=Nocardioides sp. zg-1228 TaxID=2763008 RepID=UPI0016424EAD|nr:YraN family protein [Nocardioides sp. zg-1228]MBC2933381.1 YraN family protein [Nocardioides sp. zg-1228]QSF56463.1 YraN family protein [Nocardioides sp. zg-1228]
MARPAAASPFALDAAAEHRRRLGARGESIAVRHLTGLGLVLLDRNWRCDAGEIDLVLRDGDVLVVCEVKTRTSTDFGTPLEAIDRRKADRLRRLAARWLLAHDCHPDDVRIDLVGVLTPHGRPVEVEHVEGIG